MSCEGCLTTEKERERQYQIKRQEAKEYAVKHQVTVVLFRNPQGEAEFLEESYARSIGITGEYISELQ